MDRIPGGSGIEPMLTVLETHIYQVKKMASFCRQETDGMHRILAVPTYLAGYPADLKAGYRISRRISSSTFKCLVKY
jgi:hypothetical protein